MRSLTRLSLLLVSAAALPAQAKVSDCPPAVNAAVEKAYPGGKITYCWQKQLKGDSKVEVKVTTSDKHHLEMDLKPDGTIMSTEEKIALTDVPGKVTLAFNAKYPKLKINRAERVVKADGTVVYELRYNDQHGAQEVAFTEDGSLVTP